MVSGEVRPRSEGENLSHFANIFETCHKFRTVGFPRPSGSRRNLPKEKDGVIGAVSHFQ
jgi:hypothetical protein